VVSGDRAEHSAGQERQEERTCGGGCGFLIMRSPAGAEIAYRRSSVWKNRANIQNRKILPKVFLITSVYRDGGN